MKLSPLLCASLALSAPGPEPVDVAYTLTLEPAALLVEVAVHGARGRALELELDGFGGWPQAPFDYVTDLRAEPPLLERAGNAARFRFDPPARWDGAAHLSFRIPVLDAASELGGRFGLLPKRDGDLVELLAINVLPRVLDEDGARELRRRVTVRCPEGLTLVTGWADPVTADLAVEIERVDQCVVAWHPAPRIAQDGAGADRIHVVQLNSVEDTTERVLALARPLLFACADATGVPRPGAQRVFVTGERLHVSGGQGTDHGVRLSWNPETDSSVYRHMVAHELFHAWLPGQLPPDGPSLVWFFEGFTQYLSLWIAARAGVIDANAFAERMAELERDARGSTAFGQVAFGDASIHWRDGDGALETLAYNGGALLGFHLDVALRERGTTLARVLGEWMNADEGYSLARLKQALKRHRLERRYREWIDEPAELPSIATALDQHGFYAFDEEREAHVTYLGVRCEDGVVVAIDPEGPQAERALRVGDRVRALGPRRDEALTLQAGYAWEHDLGLTELVPWWPDGGWWADVERDGEALRVAIEPWLQPGGLEIVPRADPERVRAFFDLGDAR